MAAGTVRLERGESPIDYFRITLMTGSTGQVAAVIEWLERQPDMIVVSRRPCDGVVAQAAVL